MSKYAIYILSPLFYTGILLAGRWFTIQGIDPWYWSLSRPSYTPPGSFIGIVWTVIYILSALSLILYVNAAKGRQGFRPVIALYIINGILNAAWSYVFFTKHLPGPAVIDAGLIAVTVLFVIIYAWRYSHAAAVLLLPYLLWGSFATFLTYAIYKMN